MSNKFIGNSGCKIFLLDSGVIRKMSPRINYNERLMNQCKKQKNFHSDLIKTPKILDEGYINNFYYFDMEYISGISFYEYCSTHNFPEIEQKIQNIFLNFNYFYDFKNEILKKCKTLKDFPIEIVESNNFILPHGNCHGDLTFENILVKNEEFYFIDFLDSYIETPLIDKSKLMQDTFCFWSYRNLKCHKPIHVLALLNEMLESKETYILLLINLYRIFPYANNKTKRWLQWNIKKVQQKIKKY